jgi:hypothetical protein
MKERNCSSLSRKAPVLGVVLATAVLLLGPLAMVCPADFGAATTSTIQLSAQAPVEPAPGAPDQVYPVDGFALGQDVWVAVPSVANGQDLSGTKARVYVVSHRPPEGYVNGIQLNDISGGFEVISIQQGKAFDNYLMIWAGPQQVGTYDIVLDFPPAGTFQPSTDLVDHGGKTGLPGFAVLGAGSVDYLIVTPDTGFMGKVCTRIFGVGPYPGALPEGVEFFVAFGWGNGPNGTPENGGGDDVPHGPVSATWSLSDFVDRNNQPVDIEGVGYINPDNGVYVTREETGEGDVNATYPGATSDSIPINTTAPSWVRD